MRISLKAIVAVQVIVLVSFSWANSQVLTVDKEIIDFGNVLENQPDSIPIVVANPSSHTVNISGIRRYKIYGSNDFAIKDNSFSLAAGASKQLYVKFSPRHNISYLSQLVFIDDSRRGNLVVELKGQGRYSQSYYSPTENLSEEALKAALKTLLTQNYVTLGYTSGRDKMFLTIDNLKVNGQGASVNTIIERYGAKTITGFITRGDAQNFPDGNCSSVCFNTEHTWPQSLFSQSDPMVSDLHHLYVVNEPANSMRSNYPFGVVSNPTWTNGGSKFANGVFEPRDDQKGATARSMLYFPIRHQNYSSFLNNQEAILRQWHRDFPPNARDIKRNEDIFTFQKNRNPFVDYPQLIERITSISNTSVLVPSNRIDTVGGQINLGLVEDTAYRVYSYPVVNNGNQSITVSGISLKNGSALEIAPTTVPSSILPGGKTTIKLRVKWPLSNRSFTDTLLFVWNGSTLERVKVPVTGVTQYPVPTDQDGMGIYSQPYISSNPNSGVFFLNLGPNEELSIQDALGSPVEYHFSNEPTGKRITLKNPVQGVYVLSISNSWNNYILKMIVH